MKKDSLKNIVQDIYFDYFHDEITSRIDERFEVIKQLSENNECLFSAQSFLIIGEPSKWLKTQDESFVWNKTIKILTQDGIQEIVFATLDLKSFTNPSFCLWFPTYDFTFINVGIYSKLENDFTYILTKDIIQKYGLDYFLVKPFDLE